jgi:hypothetical protein
LIKIKGSKRGREHDGEQASGLPGFPEKKNVRKFEASGIIF